MAAAGGDAPHEDEPNALKKLQAASGFVEKGTERLDWMYEQSAVQSKPDDDKLMNMPIAPQRDQDVDDVKKLGSSTAGSLFLRTATKTTEDMLRKLREDPLFHIKRQEQAARASQMANPLVMARLKKKQEKEAKKEQKKLKKAAKKDKKAQKKAKKAAKKAAKKGGGGSSSSSSSSSDAAGGMAMAAPVPCGRPPQTREKRPSPSAGRDGSQLLGPSGDMVNKREEYAARIAERKRAALESRGAPRRMSEEEKREKLQQMVADAASHDRRKGERIHGAEKREQEQAELEARMRASSDQRYFRDMREQAYVQETGTMSDRLKNQRHRRQKGIIDPLEKDQ